MLNYADAKEKVQETEKQWYQKENVDLPLLNALVNDSNELGPDTVLKDSKYNPLLNPFVSTLLKTVMLSQNYFLGDEMGFWF